MPRFFFHIRDHDRLIVDDEGLELPDVKAAVREAKASIADMQADAVLEGTDIDHQVIEVTDAGGQFLAAIPVDGR
jgi:hypothetical protein